MCRWMVDKRRVVGGRVARRTGVAVAALLAAGVLAGGCSRSIAGTWESQSIEPAMARDQFKFLRPTGFAGEFVKASIELQKDEDYTADVYYAGSMDTSTGTWTFEDDRLRLVDNTYGAYAYSVELTDLGRTLILTQPIKGTDVKVWLKRKR